MQLTKKMAGWYLYGPFQITHCPDAAVLDVEPDGRTWFLDITSEAETSLTEGSYGRYRTLREAEVEAKGYVNV